MAETIYCHSKGEHSAHSEEMLDQSKTENQQGNLKILHLHIWGQSVSHVRKDIRSFGTEANDVCERPCVS